MTTRPSPLNEFRDRHRVLSRGKGEHILGENGGDHDIGPACDEEGCELLDVFVGRDQEEFVPVC